MDSMDIFYEIDRMITGPLVSLGERLKIQHRHLTIENQGRILSLAIFLVNLKVLDMQLIVLPFSSMLLLYYFFIGVLIGVFPIALKLLHRYFDPQRADDPQKLYSDGYQAWSSVFVSITILLLAVRLNETMFTGGPIWITSITFSGAYMSFARRKENNNKRKGKSGVTVALLALLKRYREALVPAS